MTVDKVMPAAGVAAIAAWAWNGLVPSYPMGPEVAVGVAGLLATLFVWVAAFLPKPKVPPNPRDFMYTAMRGEDKT